MESNYVCSPSIRLHKGRLQSITLNTPITNTPSVIGKTLNLEFEGDTIQGFVVGIVLFHTYESVTLKVLTIEFRQNNALIIYGNTQMGDLQMDGNLLSRPRKKAKLKKRVINVTTGIRDWLPTGKKKVTWIYELSLMVGQVVAVIFTLFTLSDPYLIMTQLFLLSMTVRQLFLSAKEPIKETKEQLENLIEEWK